MNVILIYPNAYGMNMLPPSLGLFTAILKERGHKVALFDSTPYTYFSVADFDKKKSDNLNARSFDDSRLKAGLKDANPFEDLRRLVDEFKPGLIAISTVEDTYHRSVKLLESLGEDRPLTVAGGVFPTFAPVLTIDSSNGGIDMVLRGEGEETLAELCDKIERGEDFYGVAGLGYKKNGTYHQNPLPIPVSQNELPIPDYSLFEDSRFYKPMQGKARRMLPVETMRGCPYKCTYCNSPGQADNYKSEVNRKFFRKMGIKRIYEEIKTMRDVYNADSIFFWADTFLAWTNKEVEEFCEMYSEFNLPFWFNTRPETVNEFNIKRLKEVGLLRVAFGIEHGNEEFRESIAQKSKKRRDYKKTKYYDGF